LDSWGVYKMDADTRFRANTPDVTHEVIDGEAVIINLVTGNYYSLEGEGAEIWTLLISGTAVGAVADQMARSYEGDPSFIRDSVLQLVSQLQREQLILVSNGAEGPAVQDLSHQHADGNGRRPFRATVLHKFTDMQELLILDPIHEVDATGWPHKKVS
jgi:Coenzyme PQQ synthesis protein D (PqqD)